MSVYVVDASVVAKWFIKEEASESALSILGDNNRLFAPDFMYLEMDNILCKRIRRGSLTFDEAKNIQTTLRSYPVQIRTFWLIMDSAFSIANQTGRSFYDCLYIALAVHLDGQMVTADRKLYEGLMEGPFGEYIKWVKDLE